MSLATAEKTAIFAAVLTVGAAGCGGRTASPEKESAAPVASVQESPPASEPRSNETIALESASHADPRPLAPLADPTPRLVSTDPAQMRAQILTAMEAGNDDLAFELVRAARRVAPGDPQLTFLMALILSQRNRFPEAIMMLDAIGQAIPSTRRTVLGQTADWLVESGQWTLAEARYRELLDQVPDAATAHRKYAELLVRQGRRLEAADHLRQLCRLGDFEEIELRALLTIPHPFAGDAIKEQLEPIGALGNARFAIGVGNWSAAADALQRSVSAHPAAAEALLGRIHAQSGDFKSLAVWADKAPESVQTHADYWFALGTLQAHRGDHRAAVNSFCQSVLRDATDAEAYAAMSRSLAELDAPSQSAAAAKRSQLIERTQLIGKEMAESEDRDDAQTASLIDTLEALNRPYEALAWRAVRVHYGQAKSVLSQTDAREVLAQIVAEREEQLGSDRPDATREFILCGVDLESLTREGDGVSVSGGQD